MKYNALKAKVSNRGAAPDEFLNEMLAWGKTVLATPSMQDIYAPNPNPYDVFAYIKPKLGPWENLLHRLAALLEEMRVHAGLESSWDFNEGVDTTNQHSVHDPTGEETGVFQVSFDSLELGGGAMKPFAAAHGIQTVGSFITQMKSQHTLAFEYYARLVRVSVQWAGPIKRHEIDQWLSRFAVVEIIRGLQSA